MRFGDLQGQARRIALELQVASDRTRELVDQVHSEVSTLPHLDPSFLADYQEWHDSMRHCVQLLDQMVLRLNRQIQAFEAVDKDPGQGCPHRTSGKALPANHVA